LVLLGQRPPLTTVLGGALILAGLAVALIKSSALVDLAQPSG
jgi:drug/metabolite transporter (DMT)-like permease